MKNYTLGLLTKKFIQNKVSRNLAILWHDCFYEHAFPESYDMDYFIGKLNSLMESTHSSGDKVDIQELYYQNDIESQYNVEKCIQNNKEEDTLLAIKNLEQLSDRQDTEEVRALYDAGSYIANQPYKMFLVQSSLRHNRATVDDETMLRSFDNMFCIWPIDFQNQKIQVEKTPTRNVIHHWNQKQEQEARIRRKNCFRKWGFCNIDPR